MLPPPMRLERDPLLCVPKVDPPPVVAGLPNDSCAKREKEDPPDDKYQGIVQLLITVRVKMIFKTIPYNSPHHIKLELQMHSKI